MSERWRRPVAIEAIEPDPTNYMRIGDRTYQNENVTLTSRGDFERIRQGYVCAQCFEPHEHPFPERCSLCGFPMALRQLGRLELAFEGDKWIGPRESLEDELERLADTDERRAHRKDSSILVPKSEQEGQ